uniref:Phage gp6-like head-tail connector protein n=2 Tax=unclassified Mycobacterium TaxID=2642494 RepID=A0A5Q5BKU5_MYCSS
MAVEADQVAAFLGRPEDAAILATAEQAIPIVTTMVKAYIRGNGFDWEPNDELEAVIVTASARMVSNPGGLPVDTAAGPFTQSLRGAFQGWTLAELFVLNRYRRRAV